MLACPPQNPKQRHQYTAQALIDHCDTLKAVFQDQWLYLWTITPENLFVIDQENNSLVIADGLLTVECIYDYKIQFYTSHANVEIQKIADFMFNDFCFIFNHKASHHSLYLKTKVQLFRQMLVEEVFKWVDGENRVEQCLYNLTDQQAMQLDRIMMQSEYYDEPHLLNFSRFGAEIPLEVELNFKHLCLVNSVMGDNFLAVQKLIPVYDRLSTSAELMLPKRLYRMAQISFEEQFSLSQLVDLEPDFNLLKQHNEQTPHLLGFTRWIKRGYWQYQDIFNKQNFLNKDVQYWVEDIAQQSQLFIHKRAVNWLFKQDYLVIDWVSENLKDPNIRLAVTALSFVDCSKVHPHVIQLSIQYFEQVIGRLFISECLRISQQQAWFELSAEHHSYALNEAQNAQDFKKSQPLTASILYLKEWLDLLWSLDQQGLSSVKYVFKRISQVMQSYMLFLNDLVKDLPDEIIKFIEPSTQHQTHFHFLMQQYHINLDEFRQRFKHPNSQYNRSNSIFDSYIADYLIDFFQQDRTIAKNMTWPAWYQQAIRWHQHLHYVDTLTTLKLRHAESHWKRVSPQAVMYTENWKFEELNELEQIIQESVNYKHCLALSYTQRIIDGEYVAFHMSNLHDPSQHLTLGCFFKFDQLHFDQLRLPNNEVADLKVVREAKEFVHQVNEMLIWNFGDPEQINN